MKRYFSAAFAAAALIIITGCDGREEPPTQVSTSDPSAGITSNYTSQSLQADIATTSAEAVTASVSAESTYTETETTSSDIAVLTGTVSETSASSAIISNAAPSKAVTSQKASAGNVQPAETTSSSGVQQVQTTTTAATTSQLPETTIRPAPTHDEIVEAYVNEVSKKIDSLMEENPENVSVSYTLYDMDSNGTPELIIKWGSSEDTYQVTFFTYDEFGTKVLSDGSSGENANFAYDSSKNRFVLAYSNMYKGELYWMNYEEWDKDTVPHEEFTYNSDETFETKMTEFNVEWLPFARYTYSSEGELTWVYRVVNGGLEFDEIAGRDFSFIYNYDF